MLIPHYIQVAPTFTGTIPDVTANQGVPNVTLDTGSYFTGAMSFTISPAIEEGWNFSLFTGILTIDTNPVGGFGPYTVTGTDVIGSVNSNTFNITVNEFSYSVGENRVITFEAKNRTLTI